ncbi:hypothetical protein ABZX99_19410 [Streptomyces antibioticus]|uniref:hypothetical protein n=1 Tax=Streptomyces antibioticus TaxID=1890 RepID=UPI0033A90F83
MPKGIVLLTTPEGWRHTILTLEGGMLCGHLADATPATARATATTMAAGLARDVHGVRVDVTWGPPREPGTWTAQVTVSMPPPGSRR